MSQFKILDFRITLTADNKKMAVVTLMKETESIKVPKKVLGAGGILHDTTAEEFHGIAGTIELHVYDEDLQQKYLSKIGELIDVEISI